MGETMPKLIGWNSSIHPIASGGIFLLSKRLRFVNVNCLAGVISEIIYGQARIEFVIAVR
jgi:hypothetical protein